MNKSVKIVITLILITIIAGGIFGYSQYFKPHEDVDNAYPEHTLSTELLFTAFSTDSVSAMSKYADKIIQVNGNLSSMEKNDTSYILLLSIEGAEGSNIKCEMNPDFNDRLESIDEGAKVHIKGICIGSETFEDEDFGISFTDVLLTRCVISKN